MYHIRMGDQEDMDDETLELTLREQILFREVQERALRMGVDAMSPDEALAGLVILLPEELRTEASDEVLVLMIRTILEQVLEPLN